MHKELKELRDLVNRNFGIMGGKDPVLKKIDEMIKKVEPKPKKEITDKPDPK
jgi:hypothetical protein